MLQYNPTVSGSLTITGSLTVTNGVIGTVSGVDVQIFSSSINQVITGIQSSTESSDAKFETLSQVTSSVLTRLTNIESKSASVDISLSNINSKTGSYATTGSNSFYGTQVFSGSVFIANDLIVQGSSSIQYISASSVSIGTNIVQLNTDTPAVRFAGLTVQDSGSSAGVTGSMLWDSLCNRWIYSNPSTIGYSGGMLLSGPRTQTLGTEPTLTCNFIAKSGGGDHLYDSCIYESGGCVGINTNSPSYTLDVSGSVGRIKNAGGSTDLILDRGSTSAGATHQYNTAGSLKWYTGLRGLVNNNFYIFNHATSTNSLIIDETTNNVTFACGVSIGRTDTMYRLNVFYDVPKTCTTARGLAFFGSNDSLASAPFGLVITSQGGATISNRVVRMGTTDFGLANGGLLELNGTLFVCNSGCVGIGNSSPNTMLHTTISTPYGTNGTVLNSYPVATFSQCDCAGGIRGLQIGVPTGGIVSPVYLKVTNTAARFSILDESNVENFTISGNKIGIGTCNPRTKLQVTPSYNAEAPVLGCASGVAIFTSTNTNYGLQFNSTSDGSFHIQSQRFDANAVSYNLVLQPVGSGVTIGTASGTIDAANQKLQLYGSMRMDVRGVSYGEGMIINMPADGTNYGGLFLHSTSTALQTVGASSIKWGINYNYTPEDGVGAGNLAFVNANTTTMMNITSGGCVYIGKGWGATNHRINLQKPQGCTILVVSGYSSSSNDSVIISAASGAGYNGALTVMGVTTNSSTGRSISAGGSITGGGNDYAEYIVKRNDAGCIQKGQIVGIDSCKLLTDKWSLANSFVIKSTDPSFVGGDSWDKHIGNRPQQTTCITDEEFAPILAEYENNLEEARNKVDRIAFSGQVPVIVSGSYNVGDYILPIEGPDDTIVGVACSLSSLTLEDYGKTVGRVWGTCLDKAWVAVKIG
jgi:hypothetical protein